MEALPLDDPRWRQRAGAYRVPFDPREALASLAVDFADSQAWSELWSELHHQGDVGEASYAAVPTMVHFSERASSRDWNLYGLASVIEVERHRHHNPVLPAWPASAYGTARGRLVRLALADLAHPSATLIIQNAHAVIALGRGELRLGALLAELDAGEIGACLEDHATWSALYDERRRLPPDA